MSTTEIAAFGEERMLIDGALVPASNGGEYETINPATEEVLGVVAEAARQSVFPQALVGRSGIVAADALVVGGGEERRRGIPDHHETVIAASRSPGDEAAVSVHIHHRVAEGVHDLRVGK